MITNSFFKATNHPNLWAKVLSVVVSFVVVSLFTGWWSRSVISVIPVIALAVDAMSNDCDLGNLFYNFSPSTACSNKLPVGEMVKW